MRFIASTVLLFFLLININQNVAAQNIKNGNGLEVKKSSIYVLVETLTKSSRDIGLYKGRIKNKIELELRRSRIDVITKEEGLNDSEIDYYLYANVLVLDNSFKIDLKFQRPIYYQTGEDLYSSFGTTWYWGGSGSHGGESEYIINNIEPAVEAFINNFLKAN